MSNAIEVAGSHAPEAPSYQLPLLGGDDSDCLQRAARAFVERKHMLDDWSRDPVARWRVPSDLPEQPGLAIGPHHYVMQVLPFAQLRYAQETGSVSALVPADRTIGDDWKGRLPADLATDERERYRSELTDAERADPSAKEAALYTWFVPLGLFAAGEGKNRVRFLRSVDEAWIPASVERRSYPAPERIQLFQVDVCGQTLIWAALDERWIQAVPHYALGADLLRAYGVRPPTPWPRDWPAPTEVAQRFARERQSRPHPCSDVDLDDLRARERRDREVVVVSLFDLPWLRWRPAVWTGGFVLSLLATITGIVAPWPSRRDVFLGLGLGLAIGLGSSSFPLWRAERIRLRQG